jgi:hypothetical protein
MESESSIQLPRLGRWWLKVGFWPLLWQALWALGLTLMVTAQIPTPGDDGDLWLSLWGLASAVFALGWSLWIYRSSAVWGWSRWGRIGAVVLGAAWMALTAACTFFWILSLVLTQLFTGLGHLLGELGKLFHWLFGGG